MESMSASSEFPRIDGDIKTESENIRTGKQFLGFDFLRAICVVVIVAYKTKIFNIPEILFPSSLTQALSGYILSGMIGALAVPIFLQISLFLFYLKSQKTGLAYFIRKRLPRLISLHIFWVSLITLYDVLFIDKAAALQAITASPKAFFEFIVSGNSTPYFFFFSLMLMTILAEVLVLAFGNLKSAGAKIRISYGLLFAACLLIFSFSTLEPILENTTIQLPGLKTLNNLAGWDYTPINFLPYVLTAMITAQEYAQGKLATMTRSLKRKLWGLLGLTLLFFALEWILTSNRLLIQVDQGPLDHYLRLSLVFGSWLLFYLALLTPKKPSAIIQFLSTCSLGIYGFHVFFIFKRPIPLQSIPILGNLLHALPVLEIVTRFSLILAATIVLTILARKVKFLKPFF
jgi:Acyltransferase family